ncbi:uncharacterized protein UV8b_06157 [Ustilaginoidea virens]|uniref:Pyridoxamine phosphate oxidase family protein n=1 Tax=Ustilaginoidea virens TaxID=1159556 RepID=A0A8E5MJC8_USTVR|nr:uncharacterized protein UV8b_06157 [Ustilaginoidea virens]QUC21916.1 hypothetical protein UV8b_06157 [Ustilaginoidea virens]
MKLLPCLPDDLAAWAQRQPIFFTASAGKHARHVNVSPKGMADTHFAVLSPTRCAYVDRTGSGCETVAHAYENGRLSLLFVSFGEAPRIMRLFCRASVVEYDDARFPRLVGQIAAGRPEAFQGARAVIVADIFEVQTSCGYGVPRVKRALYKPGDDRGGEDGAARDVERILRAGPFGTADGGGDLDERCVFETRPTLDHWAGRMADGNAIQKYQRENNSASIDGLPGLKAGRRDAGQRLWLADLAAWAKRVAADKEALGVGFLAGVLLFAVLDLAKALVN